MKACFMGLGYIGLPTAIIAAKHGIEVVGSIFFKLFQFLARNHTDMARKNIDNQFHLWYNYNRARTEPEMKGNENGCPTKVESH